MYPKKSIYPRDRCDLFKIWEIFQVTARCTTGPWTKPVWWLLGLNAALISNRPQVSIY